MYNTTNDAQSYPKLFIPRPNKKLQIMISCSYYKCQMVCTIWDNRGLNICLNNDSRAKVGRRIIQVFCNFQNDIKETTSRGTSVSLDIQDWRLRIFHCWKGLLLFWLRLLDLEWVSWIFFLCPSLILDVTLQVLLAFYLLWFWRFWWGFDCDCHSCDRVKTKSTPSLLDLD